MESGSTALKWIKHMQKRFLGQPGLQDRSMSVTLTPFPSSLPQIVLHAPSLITETELC